MSLSLVDAHKVFLVDVCLGNPQEFFHHDLFISNSDQGGSDMKFLLQSALEFILHTPRSVMQICKVKDEFDNECIRVSLENWIKESKLLCSIYDIKDYPASAKEDFVKFLSVQDIIPQAQILDHFHEFLGEEEMEEDVSKIELITIEKGNDRCIYNLKNPKNLTSLTQQLLDIVFSFGGSLTFKVNIYPYFELQYPDRTTTGVWLNKDTTAASKIPHELEGI